MINAMRQREKKKLNKCVSKGDLAMEDTFIHIVGVVDVLCTLLMRKEHPCELVREPNLLNSFFFAISCPGDLTRVTSNQFG